MSDATRPSLDVVIVDYNSAAYTAACVASIERYPPTMAALAHVIIVDNGGDLPSAAVLSNLPYGCILVRNESNTGFAAACNQGALIGDATYLLFLNPDTELSDGSLDASIHKIQSDDSTAIVGLQMRDASGAVRPSCRHFPRPVHYWNKTLGLTKISEQLFPDGQLSTDEHFSSKAVDQVIGAFFLIRRSVYADLGGFDERFFVYFEEVDLCLRAAQKGYVTYYSADSHFYHVGGGTSDNVKAARLFYYWRSRLLYSMKHFSIPSTASILLLTLTVEPLVRLLQAIARRSWAATRDLLSAHGQLLAFLIKSTCSRILIRRTR